MPKVEKKVHAFLNRLIHPGNYAKQHKLSRETIYKYMKDGVLETIEIDGQKFIVK